METGFGDATSRGRVSEEQDKKKDEGDFDESALAALVGGSLAPPADPDAKPKAKANDDDEHKLDLRALAASVAPPPAEPANGSAAAASAAKAEAAAPAVAKTPSKTDIKKVDAKAASEARKAV